MNNLFLTAYNILNMLSAFGTIVKLMKISITISMIIEN